MTCTLAVSYFVRAMEEDRHWIVALPGITVLSGFALSRIQRRVIAATACAGALISFPVSFYRQPQAGYADLLRQLHTPARMLVSSNGSGEGPWVAVASLSERRPSSLITRASKVLVSEGWNAENCTLLTATPQAITRRLDELACGQARDLVAYCRVSPPEYPRQPLRLRLQQWEFEERIAPAAPKTAGARLVSVQTNRAGT